MNRLRANPRADFHLFAFVLLGLAASSIACSDDGGSGVGAETESESATEATGSATTALATSSSTSPLPPGSTSSGSTSADTGSTGGTSDVETSDGSSSTGEEEGPLAPVQASFIGGSAYERVQGIYVDGAGFIYLAGTTNSTDFPVTAGAYDTTKAGAAGNGLGASDGWAAKLSPDGTDIVWATYLGGSLRDSAYGIRTDSADNVYVVGATGSADFPTTAGAYSTPSGPGGATRLADAFVLSLTSDGSDLRFSTAVGGAGATPGYEENPRGSIEVDEDAGRIYVAGLASANDFPTTAGSFQPSFGGGPDDACVFALSIDGSELVASTFLGGSGSDTAFTEVELHPDGSVLVAGSTSSPDFPVTPGAFQTTLASGNASDPWYLEGDAFVARLSADLDTLVYATYLGGNASDAVGHNQGFGLDSAGRAVLVGSTRSTDFPVTAGAVQASIAGGADGFVAILSDDGSSLVASTILGGSADESTTTMFVGPDDRVYVTGITFSDDFPVTTDAWQSEPGNVGATGPTDTPFSVLSPDLTQLEYSTYVSGTGTIDSAERGRSIWATPNAVFLAGVTDSSDFPLVGRSMQSTFGGGQDGYFVRFER